MKVYRFYLSFSPGHSVTVGLCDERWELAMALLHEEVVDVVGFLDFVGRFMVDFLFDLDIYMKKTFGVVIGPIHPMSFCTLGLELCLGWILR